MKNEIPEIKRLVVHQSSDLNNYPLFFHYVLYNELVPKEVEDKLLHRNDSTESVGTTIHIKQHISRVFTLVFSNDK